MTIGEAIFTLKGIHEDTRVESLPNMLIQRGAGSATALPFI